MDSPCSELELVIISLTTTFVYLTLARYRNTTPSRMQCYQVHHFVEGGEEWSEVYLGLVDATFDVFRVIPGHLDRGLDATTA